MALVLTRLPEQSITILEAGAAITLPNGKRFTLTEPIIVTHVLGKHGHTQFAVRAPREVKIMRKEVLDRDKENESRKSA